MPIISIPSKAPPGNFSKKTPSAPRSPPGANKKTFVSSREITDNIPKETEITRLEKKLEEAQREIRMLKNQERIKATEMRLEEDRKELEKLRKGEM